MDRCRILFGQALPLVDNAALRQQLTSLERHVSGTRETVTHPAVASAHDDLSTACCGALVVCGNRLAFDGTFNWVSGDNSPAANETYEQQRAREAEANAAWQRQRFAAFVMGGGSGALPFDRDGRIDWDKLPRNGSGW